MVTVNMTKEGASGLLQKMKRVVGIKESALGKFSRAKQIVAVQTPPAGDYALQGTEIKVTMVDVDDMVIHDYEVVPEVEREYGIKNPGDLVKEVEKYAEEVKKILKGEMVYDDMNPGEKEVMDGFIKEKFDVDPKESPEGRKQMDRIVEDIQFFMDLGNKSIEAEMMMNQPGMDAGGMLAAGSAEMEYRVPGNG